MKTKLTVFGPILIIALLITSGFSQEHPVKWYSDFEEVKEIAQKEDKLIFMRFQGSDWCTNCWRMDTALFEKPVFEEFAKDKFVLLALDFPAKEENKLPQAQAAENQKLQEKFNPAKQFPAAFILTTKGEVMGQLSVRPNPTEWYIENIKEILDKK